MDLTPDPDMRLPTAASVGDLVSDGLSTYLTGVPKFLYEPLTKAYALLVRGVIGIPEAQLTAIASDIKSKQEAKEAVRAAFAKAAITEIQHDPALRARAAEHFISTIVSEQERREKVFEKAVENLKSDEHPSQTETETVQQQPQQIDDDWLTRFSKYAGDATSERLQDALAKVLAGQIRQPGQFSLFTLDFISKMSQSDAEFIGKLAPFTINHFTLDTDFVGKYINYHMETILSGLGIISSNSIGASRTVMTQPMMQDLTMPGRSSVIFGGGKTMFLAIGPAGQKSFQFKVRSLTTLGAEILRLYDVPIDVKVLDEFARDLVQQNIELFWRPTPKGSCLLDPADWRPALAN